MSSAEIVARADGGAPKPSRPALGTWRRRSGAKARALAAQDAAAGASTDVIAPDTQRDKERFVPVTKLALVERLTRPQAWAPAQADEARRFFRFLDYWRRQTYNAKLLEIERSYEPFSPDSDLLMTRQLTGEERRVMQRRVVESVSRLLEHANFVRVDPKQVELILTRDSHYGLDLHVDLGAFEELLLFYRGASTRTEQRRKLSKFLRKEEFEVPIFRRLFVLFKLKPEEMRVREVMAEQRMTRKEAEKYVRRLRALVPAEVKDGNIYMKLFKNMPRSDIEMIFPNTRVKFRLFDKLKLGVTAGGTLSMGAISSAGKLALLASNPIAAAGAVVGLGGIAFRQLMNFMNQRQKYMVVMAQNLYFHAMADNRGVMIKLADRAAEEDFKEEVLLYSVLCKEKARRSDLPAIDAAIEQYLHSAFGVSVNFDLEDALERLIADGIVTETAAGELVTLPPREAAARIDVLWDQFLDQLPGLETDEGIEIEADGPDAAAPQGVAKNA